MTVIIVIAMLSLMLLSTVSAIRAKAAQGSCFANLRSLYAAASAYTIDHESWPQVEGDDPEEPAFARQWIYALKPYGLNFSNWICPTIQTALRNPILNEQEPRIDYIPTQFGETVNAPWLYPTHPWFMERADVHGNGNLIILANGSQFELQDLVSKTRAATK